MTEDDNKGKFGFHYGKRCKCGKCYFEIMFPEPWNFKKKKSIETKIGKKDFFYYEDDKKRVIRITVEGVKNE